jgi:hypothetical protein
MIEYVITSDGRTVWINGPNGLIGRFSRNGIDVHNEDNTGCLACSAGPCGLLEWELFKSAMLEHRGIAVPDEWMPDYLKEQQA